jgi:integrase
VNALRALYRQALLYGDVHANPTQGLRLPAVRGRRDRVVSAAEAEALLAALDRPERAVWAVALYAGLRLGELQALRWEDVDLGEGVLHVHRGWDARGGEIAPKTRAGRRKVPIFRPLRAELAARRLACPWPEGLVFGREPDRPFGPKQVSNRAKAAWEAAELRGVGLHEARHCAASYMIAADVNIKAVQTYLGHSSITETLNRYGHLLPGAGEEAVSRMDAYLAREVPS